MGLTATPPQNSAAKDQTADTLRVVQEALQRLQHAPNVRTMSRAELRTAAERFGLKTSFGSYAYGSMVKSRSAGLTVYVGSEAVRLRKPSARQQEILRQAPQTLELVHKYLARAPLLKVQRRIGMNQTLSPLCTSYVSLARPEMVRIPAMWGETLFEATSVSARSCCPVRRFHI